MHVPFTEQDTNSPMKLRIPETAPDNTSYHSDLQIKQTVNQIQDMINQLQQQKSENQTDGTKGEEVYKTQFEQMMNDLKT